VTGIDERDIVEYRRMNTMAKEETQLGDNCSCVLYGPDGKEKETRNKKKSLLRRIKEWLH